LGGILQLSGHVDLSYQQQVLIHEHSPYEYTHAQPIPVILWVGLILKLMKSIIKSVLLSMWTLPTTKKIISHKYAALMLNLEFESR
jgi:hypothetical protein